MKKRFFFGVLAVLGMTACSQDEVLDVNRNGDEITFNVVTNKASRADNVFCNSNPMTEFYVWANYKDRGTVYIAKDEVERGGSSDSYTWENTTTRYWPSDNNGAIALDFYASVGHDITVTYDDTNKKNTATFNNVTISTDLAEQKDILYAVKQNQSHSTSSATSATPVSLNFRHALSQIVFKAKNTNKNLHVEISSVSIVNVNSAGTFTFPTANTDGNKYGDHQTNSTNKPGDTAELDANGSWGTTATPVVYKVSLTTTTNGTTKGIDVDYNSTTPVVNLTDVADASTSGWNNVMLLLPQQLTPWSPATEKLTNTNGVISGTNGAYFLLDCKIQNIAGSSLNANDVVHHDGLIAIPIESVTWLQGKKYVYTFIFGAGNGGYNPGEDTDNDGKDDPVLTPITFTVSVDDFVSVTGTDINMVKP